MTGTEILRRIEYAAARYAQAWGSADLEFHHG